MKRLTTILFVAGIASVFGGIVLYDTYKNVILNRTLEFGGFFFLTLAFYLIIKLAHIDFENSVREIQHITIGKNFDSGDDAIKWLNEFSPTDVFVMNDVEFGFISVLSAGLTNNNEKILGYITVLTEKR